MKEILTGQDPADQARAATIFGLKKCRRGLCQIESAILNLVRVFASGGVMEGSLEQRLLGELLFAVGRMDTARSHSIIARLIKESPSSLVRSAALDGTAFEINHFELDLVRPFASLDSHPEEILSALYSLGIHLYADKSPEEARNIVGPLLKHSDALVRDYAVRLLMIRGSNLDLILPLSNDPEPLVREGVLDVMTRIKLVREWTGGWPGRP